MRDLNGRYDALADLLSYPDGRFDEKLATCRVAFRSFPGSAWERTACQAPPGARIQARQSLVAVRSQAEPGTEWEAVRLLDDFAGHMQRLAPEEREELFTRTFDLDPICSLEVGWHLFGENYSRGEFLVEMRQALGRYGIEETTELPDHLTQALRVVCRMPPRQADRFTMTRLLPALEKMLAGLHGKDSPYALLLEATRSLLTSPYGAIV